MLYSKNRSQETGVRSQETRVRSQNTGDEILRIACARIRDHPLGERYVFGLFYYPIGINIIP
jgi:hypothetical protein